MTINEALKRFRKKHTTLTLRILTDDDPEGVFQDVLIQGKAAALLSLADLLVAVATEKEEDVQIAPFGAGSVLFSKESTVGIYLSRVGKRSPRRKR